MRSSTMTLKQIKIGANSKEMNQVIDTIRSSFNEKQMQMLYDKLEKRLHFNEAF